MQVRRRAGVEEGLSFLSFLYPMRRKASMENYRKLVEEPDGTGCC